MSEDMIKALRNGQQYDQDGVRCIVSRQACHEAADIVEASQAEYKKGFDEGCAHIIEDYKSGERLDLRASQARIAQLEAALKDVIVKLDDPTGNDPLFDMRNARVIARAALKAKP
jgi:hypothetical protein